MKKLLSYFSSLLVLLKFQKRQYFLLNFILLYFITFSFCKSQTIIVTDGIILNRSHRGGEVRDISSITLKPGFHFKAENNNTFHAFIVKDPFREHFSNSSNIIDEIIRFNSSVSKDIPLITFTIPYDTYSNRLCFSYDEAGNYTTVFSGCPSVRSLPNRDLINLKQEIDYESLLFVTPNPTGGLINILWDKTIANSLNKIHIVPFNGSKSIQVQFKMDEYKTSYDLRNYPKGIYFIEFILKDGQRVAKKIIKL